MRRPVRAPPLPAVPEPAGWTATPSSAATTASPTTRTALRRRARADPHAAHRPRRGLPGRRAGLVRLGLDRRPGARPTPTPIPRAPWLADPGWTHRVAGWSRSPPGYGLLVDNLLDLSHETYLHGGYIGTPEVAETPITTEVDEDAGIVYVSRHMDDAECPPFYAKSHRHRGPDHALAGHRVPRRPACTCCTAGSRRSASLPDADGSDPDAFHVEIVYAITPRDRAARRTTSGRSPATSRSTTRASPSSCARTTAPWCCRTSTRSTSSSRCSPPSPTATRSCQHQHRHRRPRGPADARPAGRGTRRQPVSRCCDMLHRRPGLPGATGCPAPTGCAAAATAAPSTRPRTRSRCGSGCSPTPTRPTVRRGADPVTAVAQLDRDELESSSSRRRESASPTASSSSTCATRPAPTLPAWAPGAHIDLVPRPGGLDPAVLAVRRPGRPARVAGRRAARAGRPRRLGVRARRAGRGRPRSTSAARATTSRCARRPATCSSRAASASPRSCR